MTPQPSDIVPGLASIETLQCKHLLAASHAACVISPLHKISNFLGSRYGSFSFTIPIARLKYMQF